MTSSHLFLSVRKPVIELWRRKSWRGLVGSRLTEFWVIHNGPYSREIRRIRTQPDPEEFVVKTLVSALKASSLKDEHCELSLSNVNINLKPAWVHA